MHAELDDSDSGDEDSDDDPGDGALGGRELSEEGGAGGGAPLYWGYWAALC